MAIWLCGNRPVVDSEMATWEKVHNLFLPAAYKDLLRVHNGGILAKNHFPVAEPTSYGLADAEIYTIAGLNDLKRHIQEEQDVELPGTQIYFHQDRHRYIGLDYQTAEPSVIYVDFETLQTLVVAENFERFLGMLYFSPFNMNFVPDYPLEKLEQMLAMANVKKTLEILQLLEDYAAKNWYLTQIDGLLHSEEAPYRQAGIELLENQIYYFRRKLDAKRVDSMLQWLESQHFWPEKVAELRKEWED